MKDQIAPFLRAGKPLPLTYEDYANRAGRIPIEQAKGAVDALARQGFVTRKLESDRHIATYDLTPLGLTVARSMGAAE